MAHLKKGQRAEWNWGNGIGEGKIVETFTADVTRRIKGKDITRHASKAEPAYLLKQEDGSRVLKSASELKGRS